MSSTEDIQLIDVEAGDVEAGNVNDNMDVQRQNTEQMISREFGALQIERYIRLICSGTFIIGSLILFYCLRERSPYEVVAYCMTLVQALWLIQFLGVVLTMQHLHSIVVLRKVVPDTLLLVVPYAVKEYKKIIMSSISAMSSMRGSNLFYLLGSSSNICFGMVFSVASFKWYEFKVINVDTGALVLLVLSTFGSTIITGWELDLNSKLSTGLHYFGALVTFIAAPTAFAIYQDWSALSVILMVVTYICLGIFGSVYAFAEPQYDNNPGMVHKVSMFCIIVELIAVLNGMICVILFIYCMNGNVIL